MTQASPRRPTPGTKLRPSRTPSSIITETDRGHWLPEEDRRLIRLVQKFGTKWARIEKEHMTLPLQTDEISIENRTGTQLKDRARNLKVKLYRYAALYTLRL